MSDRDRLMLSTAALIAALGLSGCTGSRPPQIRLSQGEVDACRVAGGAVGTRGMMGMQMCVIPFSDGGRTCTDKSECSGACIVVLNSVSEPRPRDGVGACQKDNAQFGCFSEVRHSSTTRDMR